jgi:hypothetical protein
MRKILCLSLFALAAGLLAAAPPSHAAPAAPVAPAEGVSEKGSSYIYLGYDYAKKEWGYTVVFDMAGFGKAGNKYSMFPQFYDANTSKWVHAEFGGIYYFQPYGVNYAGNIQSSTWTYVIPLESAHGQAIFWWGAGVEFHGRLYWDDAPGAPAVVQECVGTVYPD